MRGIGRAGRRGPGGDADHALRRELRQRRHARGLALPRDEARGREEVRRLEAGDRDQDDAARRSRLTDRAQPRRRGRLFRETAGGRTRASQGEQHQAETDTETRSQSGFPYRPRSRPRSDPTPDRDRSSPTATDPDRSMRLETGDHPLGRRSMPAWTGRMARSRRSFPPLGLRRRATGTADAPGPPPSRDHDTGTRDQHEHAHLPRRAIGFRARTGAIRPPDRSRGPQSRLTSARVGTRPPDPSP